jgi:C-terminal processing protease CtpA/Prc
MMRFKRLALLLLAASALSLACNGLTQATNTPETSGGLPTAEEPAEEEPSATQSELPPAPIQNDEGGPVAISGEVVYTNPFFTAGVAEPLIILEDQAGFIDRDEGFIMPPESQTLGQITSDFYTSPFTYSIALPIEPQGTLRDVDNDGEGDTGLMVFAVAYWTNAFGDPFLEQRDLGGGGWSTAYASTRVSEDAATENEVVGGKLLVYAPDDQQGFPSSFGADGLLFTEDDPVVALPQGYTVVDLDTDPFTFDRSREPVIDLIEPEDSALVDFSDLSYTEAFDSMVEMMSDKYAFTELKHIDWAALSDQYRPRFVEADERGDSFAYQLALRDFLWEIPDGHVGFTFTDDLNVEFSFDAGGGLGMAIRDVDDGRVLVNYLVEGGPAAQAGIQLGAEIVELDGQPIDSAVEANRPWSGPFSATHTRRLQQLRYAIRFPVGTEVEVTFQNPGSTSRTVTLTAVPETESLGVSSFYAGETGYELPVEYEILPGGYGYVKVYSFFDNELLTVQLWERMIQTMNDYGVPGLIVDMRQNGGGSGFLADQMAAYFFDDVLESGNVGYYDESLNDFFFDTRTVGYLYPPAPDLRYHGDVALIVGPACASACEFFSYDMTIDDRAAVVGFYPTAGLGGSVEDFDMPDGITVRYTIGRAVDVDGNVHIEGRGVVPTEVVPFTEEALFSAGDPELDTAIAVLDAR